MLTELRVENLLLIERAELRLAPGLNAITGETGAGKTMLAHALDLLLGGRARPQIVRPGASEAYVEGVFDLPEQLRAEVGERLPDDCEEVVLGRRVSAEGRTRAYVNGRSATVGDLRELGAELLAFYGQHEHRRLTLASAQRAILDRACDAGQEERLAACAGAHRELRAAEDDAERLRESAGARERELDLLRFELDEVERADPAPGEADDLRAERERLRHAESLRSAAAAGGDALDGDAAGAAAALAPGLHELEGVAGVDGDLDALAERVRALIVEADDVAAELRRYVEGIDAEPGRLEVVEERLSVLERLERKHGGTLQAALGHAAGCRARIAELDGVDEALAAATELVAAARARLRAAADAVHDARATAAPALASAVRDRLAALAMEGAEFEIVIEALGDDAPPAAHGADAITFLLASNPGVPPAPLGDIASGGELSRVMLALLSVAHERAAASDGSAPLLVFDEVDAGVGGQTARAVGAELRALAAGRQVLCITHLPQIASLAERHFRIEKDVAADPARTTVLQLDGGDVVGELARMLGAGEDDRTARRHARELLRAA